MSENIALLMQPLAYNILLDLSEVAANNVKHINYPLY